MIRVHHASQTRSVRVVWLLEELGIPYELVEVDFQQPDPRPFVQKTPFGKVPVLEDDGVVLFESGAILEYLLERHGEGRLAPPPGSPERARFLQWMHFAESTAFAGLGPTIWATRFRGNADEIPDVLSDYRAWTEGALETLERELGDGEFACGDAFTAADVMLGYTLLVARAFGILADEYPRANAYLDRLAKRPAFVKALRA